MKPLIGNIFIKHRNDKFLKSDDVSYCPRCGEFQNIVHIFAKDHDADRPIKGLVCCRCLYATGDANIFTVISCKRWARKIEKGNML